MKHTPKYHPVRKKRGLSRRQRKNILSKIHFRLSAPTLAYDYTLYDIVNFYRQNGTLMRMGHTVRPRIVKINKRNNKIQYKIQIA